MNHQNQQKMIARIIRISSEYWRIIMIKALPLQAKGPPSAPPMDWGGWRIKKTCAKTCANHIHIQFILGIHHGQHISKQNLLFLLANSPFILGWMTGASFIKCIAGHVSPCIIPNFGWSNPTCLGTWAHTPVLRPILRISKIMIKIIQNHETSQKSKNYPKYSKIIIHIKNLWFWGVLNPTQLSKFDPTPCTVYAQPEDSSSSGPGARGPKVVEAPKVPEAPRAGPTVAIFNGLT